MDAFNSLNVLPIYTSVAYQNSNKWYAFGNIWPLVSPTNSLLPFQFVVPYNITSASEVRIKNSNSGETYQSGITPEIDSSMYDSSGYSVIKVKEQTFPSLTLEEGRYYLEISISDGSGTYSFVSDIFTAVSDLSKYIKIEYWNDENLYYKGGEISYTNDFKFIMYVCSSIGKPEYEFEEELTERAGYKFLESQISNKLYKFTFVAPEFICDAMRLIRMSDYIVITSLGKKFNALTFSYEPEWEEQGDLASVEVEFTIDNIIQKLASFNRRQKQDFYNALLANEVEALKFDDESVAQYYKDFQQTYSGTNFIDGKLIRELDELTSLLDSTGYLPIDIGTGAARKIELSIITESIKSSLSEKFLRKDQADKTNFLVKFLAGLEAGEFVSGMIGGKGAKISAGGVGEMESLTLRSELIVPKITFNCTDVISGDKANTFAFGTIKSVDKDNMTAELDLLEGELGTLHVEDILRGVFHRINDENSQDTISDANGFYQYAGFSTAYFTPTEIIENSPGVMKFKYELQPGTIVHPEPGMTFFAYGNFSDTSRQAMTYETRYYTRRLKNVNTWIIDPTKNISMQDGLLDGLTIGGFSMSGYGTFQENCYFTGVNIQFTPEQQEAIKGESAYNVTLSEYNGVVIIDDNGNIISGYVDIVDVVSGENDVVSGENDVVATKYYLKTRIQAWKGSKELFYSDTYTAGSYMITVEAHGCEYLISDGVVFVTNITNTNRAWIDIKVNCEGNVEFTQTYNITFVRNGNDPAILDLENEMFNVVSDEDGNVLEGLPISTKAHIYMGTEEIDITEITLIAPEGVETSVTGNTIYINSISSSTGRSFSITVTASYTYDGGTFQKTTTINVLKVQGGLNATIYELFPSLSFIKVNSDGTYSDSNISCSVKRTIGEEVVFLESLPSDIRIDYSIDGGSKQDYSYNSNIQCSTIKKYIQFVLYMNETMIDRETIYVLYDGKDGEPGEPGKQGITGCVLRSSEWSVGTEYRNDSNLTSGVRFIDCALVRDNNYATGWRVYMCKVTHVSSLSITYENTEYWEEFSENVGSIFTSLILAKNAKITFLSGNEILIQNGEGVVTCGLSGSEEGDKIRFWAGSQTPDSAPCKINSLGEIYGSKGIFSGSICMPFTFINNDILPGMTVKGASGVYVVTAKQQTIVMDSLDKKIKEVNGLRFSLLVRIHALEEGVTWDDNRFELSFSKTIDDTTWPSCFVINGATTQGRTFGIKKSCLLELMYIPKVLSSDKIHAVADLAILNYDSSYMSYENWDNSVFSVTPPDTDIVEI